MNRYSDPRFPNQTWDTLSDDEMEFIHRFGAQISWDWYLEHGRPMFVEHTAKAAERAAKPKE